jgi:hypothetical protein
MIYKLYKTDKSILEPDAAMTVGVSPQVSFTFDPANTDYQAYLKWLEEGNTPEQDGQPAAV